MSKPIGFRVTAAFLLDGRWQWRTFVAVTTDPRAAIADHGRGIGAKCWATHNATVREITRIGPAL